MAPVNTPWKRSHSGDDDSTTTGLDLGASIGIAVGFAFLASALLVAGAYCYFNRRRRSTRHSPRASASGVMKCETPGTGSGRGAPSSDTRLARVFAVFSPKPRMPRGRRRDLPGDGARHRQLPDKPVTPHMPDKELDELRKPAAELEGSVFGDGQALHGADQLRGMTPSPFEEATQQGIQGPMPPYSTGTKSEQDVSSVAHYRPEDASQPPLRSLDISNLALPMPSSTEAPPAAWHRKRTGPPPPLTIAPPAHSRSPSDGYSTYATTRSPYEYYSFNPPPLPSSSSIDAFAPSLPCSTYSLHSSDSTRSNQPLRRPRSPQSPVSATSMGRSDSGVQTDSRPLAPPPLTPTFQQSQPQSQTQTQRIPSDVTEFVCLGPLPDSIPMPSPDQFRTERQQQPRSPPPSAPSPVSSCAGSTSPAYFQDPLLHESDPFRPPRSPASLTFSAMDEPPLQHRQDSSSGLFGVARERRPSTDSLGSNFTVEEEARIQAQVVKNLEMLGQERVVGGEDIVHIPQISGRRYSWEES